MRERITTLGGRVAISATPDQGIRLEVEVPIRDAEVTHG
jgi:signal transduction histidine kinase